MREEDDVAVLLGGLGAMLGHEGEAMHGLAAEAGAQALDELRYRRGAPAAAREEFARLLVRLDQRSAAQAQGTHRSGQPSAHEPFLQERSDSSDGRDRLGEPQAQPRRGPSP